MSRIWVVKIARTGTTISKCLWAFASETRAHAKCKEMNEKDFEKILYEVEEIRFDAENESDEPITEDDF